MNTFLKYSVLAVLLLGGAVMYVLSLMYTHQTNGSFGFPLDDPWIHLQFAKNLHDYGSFSYYKNEMVTSGSTSPLYTFMLAAGFFITSNEMILSYSLGILFFLLAGWWMFKVALLQFEEDILLAAGALLLLLFEPRLEWVALSGMETTLFLFLLLGSYYVYRMEKPVLFGVASGLMLWCRPETVVFLTVIGIDIFYKKFIVRSHESQKKSSHSYVWLKKSIIIFICFAVGYVGFNFWLSGSVLPNTFAAKLKYYSNANPEYPQQVFHYLTDGHLRYFSLFVVVEIISVLFTLVKRKSHSLLVPLIWSLALFLAYWKDLPRLYQEGRYLMPILPLYILLGIGGLNTILAFVKQHIKIFADPRKRLAISAIVVIVVGIQFMIAFLDKRVEYASYCGYINDRQVRTGRWLKDNVPADAVIATHDVGAIAFYSERRITDMVGLVSPEMISNIGSLDKLRSFLTKKKTTHLALLRNWFEVDNQNPLFQTDVQHPEIMEVFSYDPLTTHFVPQNISGMLDDAGYYLSIGNVQQAGPLLARSVQIDPQCSKAHFLLGRALMMVGKFDAAEKEFHTSITLHASYLDAEASLAEVTFRNNHADEAIRQLELLVTNNPGYANGYRALAEIYRSTHRDSTKAGAYMQRYNELSGQGIQ
jgi:tetratricopeptide (TPR) repeat protein